MSRRLDGGDSRAQVPALPAPEPITGTRVGIRLVAAIGALAAGIVAVVVLVELVRSVLG